MAHPAVFVCPQQPVKEVLPLPRHPSPLPVTSSSPTPAAALRKHTTGSIQHVQVASSGDEQRGHIFAFHSHIIYQCYYNYYIHNFWIISQCIDN